jgi:hypothetical protein
MCNKLKFDIIIRNPLYQEADATSENLKNNKIIEQ